MSDPSGAGKVIEISTAQVPKNIASERLLTVIRELKELTSGVFAKSPGVELVARQLRLVLIALARGEETDARVLDLSIALEDIVRALTTAPAAPARSPDDTAHIATLERKLTEAQTRTAAFEQQLTKATELASRVNEGHAGEAARRRAAEQALVEAQAELDARTVRIMELERAHGEHSATLAATHAKLTEQERHIVTARERRATTELDELRAATEALRTEQAHAAEAMAKVAAAAAAARAADAHLADATRAIAAAAMGAASPVAVADRVVITAAIAERDAWLRGAQDHLAAVSDELDALHMEIADIDARIRVHRAATADRSQHAAITARCAQLEAYAQAVVHLKNGIEAERRTLAARLTAMEVLAVPLATCTVLPTIPQYPQETEVPPHGATDAAPGDAGAADPDTDEPRWDPTELASAVTLFAVLYDAIAQYEDAHGIPRRNRPIGKVARCATEVTTVLQQRGWTVPDAIKRATCQQSEALRTPYLKFRGRIGALFFNTTYLRTSEPLPDAWRAMLSDGEREAFLRAYFTPVPTPAAPTATES